MYSVLKTEKQQVYALYSVLVLAAAFGNMSQTALNAMMPDVISEFGVTMGVGQWLTTIYMLVFGITVPMVSFLVKRLSTKNLMYIAASFSVAGLIIAIFSVSFEMLFIGRICQAISTGLVMPLTQTMAMVRFPPEKRATAMGVAGIAMGVAPSAGPTLGGLMDTAFGWRSFFILLLGITVLLLIVTIFFVSSGKPFDKNAKFDSISYVLSTLGFGGLLLGFSNASSHELWSYFVLLPITLGILCLVVFVWRQNRVDEPLINMDIFKSQRYRVSFYVLSILFMAHLGIMLILSLFVQDISGGTSLDAGLVLLPGIAGAVIISPLSGYLTDKVGVRKVTIVSGAVFLCGSILMALVDETTPMYVTAIYQTIRSLGISGLIGPLTTWGLSQLSRSMVTDGSTFALATRQTIASLGTSVMVFIMTIGTSLSDVPVLGYQHAFAFSAVLTAIGFILILIRVR